MALVIVVESPLNEERAVAVLAETRKLVPGKAIRYVVNSHHHFDHAGGLRSVAADGITVITHESSRAFLEQALAAPATMTPDRQAKAGRKPLVEGVRDRRTLTDGTRTVEIYHLAGSTHYDGLLVVYLPKERFLVEADVYTAGASECAGAHCRESAHRESGREHHATRAGRRSAPAPARPDSADGRDEQGDRPSELARPPEREGYWYSSTSAREYTICLLRLSTSTRRSPCTV